MRILSTGQKSTLGNHLKIAEVVLGENSPAVAYLRKKIEDSPMGEDEEVIADEAQMVNLLFSIHLKGSFDDE